MDNTSIRKGATGLALSVSLSLGNTGKAAVTELINENAGKRQVVEERRRKERQQRSEAPLVELVVLKIANAVGVLQAQNGGLELKDLPAHLASCLDAALASVQPGVSIAGNKAVGYPYSRLIQAIKESGAPQSHVLLRAVRLIQRRTAGKRANCKRKVSTDQSKKVRVVAHGVIHAEEGKKLSEQIRSVGNRLSRPEGRHPGIDIPADLVLAFVEWLQCIRVKSAKLAHELEKLGISILENGIEERSEADKVLQKLLSIPVMPPEIIRDLLFSEAEWREPRS